MDGIGIDGMLTPAVVFAIGAKQKLLHDGSGQLPLSLS